MPAAPLHDAMGEIVKKTAALKDLECKHVTQMWSTYICVLHGSSVIMPLCEIPGALEARSDLHNLWVQTKGFSQPPDDLQQFLKMAAAKVQQRMFAPFHKQKN